MSEQKPENLPPIEETSLAAEDESKPIEQIPEEIKTVTEAEAEAPETPSETPPTIPPKVEDTITGIAAAVWHKSKKVTALWSINQNRNSWIGVSGLGWKKLANNSDSSVVALTMLASHAKQTGSNVNLREEAGQIKEMYVW
jgi:hypothetical protein